MTTFTAEGKLAQELPSEIALVLGILFVLFGCLLAWNKAHIRHFTRVWGDAAFPWTGWFRTLAVYWLPGMMIVMGLALLFGENE